MTPTRPVPLPAGVASRVVAARVLDAVLHRGHSLKAELASSLPTLPDVRDRALVEAICFAVVRQPARYAAAIDGWTARPLGRRDAPLRALLYVGLAQLDPLGLPSHAAVDATVEATRAIKRPHQAGLVNALLRRALRDGVPAGDPSAHWPGWLRDRIARDWPDDIDSILSESASPPPMWLRVNLQRGSREAYVAALADSAIAAGASDEAAEALRLEPAVPVSTLPSFADGAVSVQDIAAQRVADALAPPPGCRVLDACAAPGGKTAHLLERDPSLAVTALDIDARRLDTVRSNLGRLGLRATTVAADAADTAWWDGVPFDVVLLDAPCSATGIVRRQPDVLLHRRASDIDALVALQARLLDATWTTLAPGGVLLYATCSILKDENEGQVDAFLARTLDAVAEPLPDDFGRDAGVGRQRLPGEGGGDGFFYARVRKRAGA